mmetsp:Transcript_12464/g.29738  ORF Transcript_12464/g.29738 Transcript_12464/m.29738 type:complete len:95 (+) Transcript_12464:76-360(+)
MGHAWMVNAPSLSHTHTHRQLARLGIEKPKPSRLNSTPSTHPRDATPIHTLTDSLYLPMADNLSLYVPSSHPSISRETGGRTLKRYGNGVWYTH